MRCVLLCFKYVQGGDKTSVIVLVILRCFVFLLEAEVLAPWSPHFTHYLAILEWRKSVGNKGIEAHFSSFLTKQQEVIGSCRKVKRPLL